MKRNYSVILVLRSGFAVAAYNIPVEGEDDVAVFRWTVNIVRVQGLIWRSFFAVYYRVFLLDDLEDVLSFKNGEDALPKQNHRYWKKRSN